MTININKHQQTSINDIFPEFSMFWFSSFHYVSLRIHYVSLRDAVVEVLFGHTAADGHSQALDDLPSVRPEDVDPHHLRNKDGPRTVQGPSWRLLRMDIIKSFYVILCHSMSFSDYISWSSQEFDEIPWNSMNSDESLMHSEHQSKDAILLNFLKDSDTSLIVFVYSLHFQSIPVWPIFCNLWSVWQRSISCRYEACN